MEPFFLLKMGNIAGYLPSIAIQLFHCQLLVVGSLSRLWLGLLVSSVFNLTVLKYSGCVGTCYGFTRHVSMYICIQHMRELYFLFSATPIKFKLNFFLNLWPRGLSKS